MAAAAATATRAIDADVIVAVIASVKDSVNL